MDIDLVYTYVDGNDEKWLEKRNTFSKDQSLLACRFRDNNELVNSLRSVEKYAGWIRNIYIVTDHQKPKWLNVDHEKIHIIDHTDIMPADILPCFNSYVIESYLDLIPGLSEIFLYANDDTLFGNYVTKDFFYKNGKPIVLMKEAKVLPDNNYHKIILNSQKLIYQKYGCQYDLIPSHNIDVYSKSAIKKCKEEFAEEFAMISKDRFRTDAGIERIIFHYYMLANDLCELKTGKPSAVNVLKKLIFPQKYLDYIGKSDIHTFMKSKLAQLYFKRGPKLLCLNDSEKTTKQDLEKYNQLMKKKFPKKSSFEN